jgi:hypothetical protein
MVSVTIIEEEDAKRAARAFNGWSQLAGFARQADQLGRQLSRNSGRERPWIRAICGTGPGSRSAGRTVTGGGVACPRCQERMGEWNAKGRSGAS